MPMSARTIDGRALARRILEQTAEEIRRLGIVPGLGVILAGGDPASKVYVQKKKEAAEEIGVLFDLHEFDESVTEGQLLSALAELNGRPDIHGIVVQLPLPDGLDTDRIIRAVDPKKDVDGFHPELLDRLDAGETDRTPGLVEGIELLFAETGRKLAGQQVTVVSNGDVFSRPLGACLRRAGAAVETVRSDSPGMREAVGRADLLITAVGQPGLVRGDMLKPDSVVIDVGTTRVGRRIVGDVDRDTAGQVAGWITPVPGGVGPVTVAMLLKNVVRLAKGET
ncbi:MAG: bifunctional 5,10-methylenetetrahydrofolate dehydrogenase/5,10-methenyltetrahydrofolate cyclohydrolase [bacterium]